MSPKTTPSEPSVSAEIPVLAAARSRSPGLGPGVPAAGRAAAGTTGSYRAAGWPRLSRRFADWPFDDQRVLNSPSTRPRQERGDAVSPRRARPRGSRSALRAGAAHGRRADAVAAGAVRETQRILAITIARRLRFAWTRLQRPLESVIFTFVPLG